MRASAFVCHAKSMAHLTPTNYMQLLTYLFTTMPIVNDVELNQPGSSAATHRCCCDWSWQRWRGHAEPVRSDSSSVKSEAIRRLSARRGAVFLSAVEPTGSRRCFFPIRFARRPAASVSGSRLHLSPPTDRVENRHPHSRPPLGAIALRRLYRRPALTQW